MSETSNQTPSTTEKRETQDVLDQLMKPEVQESLTVLVENLPKLAEMVTILTKAYDLAQSVASDQVLIDDLKGGMNEFVKPITEKAKGVAAAAIEASDRAQAEHSTIGLFGLLKMLKDPQVQKTFRFVQAFLDVQAERQQQR
ncbi:DUF1641 domain-containing protein [Paenibacillus chitinolyticus]|uniref:DUF1641 domain-containing protein n=1 Tax=Paenibacillus chitinolyticus TaxID=79263 RepID=A0A410WPJ9_9BACL|nr:MULTISPECIES: DUF1641 domain-containing protein [Paenibacillus]MCY9590839.1 DUF1641 domain-containing protein [Paenibacillus chitinolyticus]MCY9598746.1 DUF1641 domain-containing protein [Paenibacillus chitinolyticus]QAV16285.1 DUF1641 domain-containing protein [Paenibacillus chitinolyticus]GKS11596.1 hypothetical protein YDYSY3_25960 [Paenibacillus chitinolyticus]